MGGTGLASCASRLGTTGRLGVTGGVVEVVVVVVVAAAVVAQAVFCNSCFKSTFCESSTRLATTEDLLQTLASVLDKLCCALLVNVTADSALVDSAATSAAPS